MSKTTKAEQIARRFPVLASVPPEKRQPIVKKAMLHPAVLGTALFFALFVIPRCLEYTIVWTGYREQSASVMAALMLFLCAAFLFFLLFFFLSFVLMPWVIKRILKKNEL